jgi:cephalosporin-C deacetylase-like acetyl esterase
MNRFLILVFLGSLTLPAAASAEGPLDMFPPEVMAKIQDRSTLNPQIVSHRGWSDVYFDSEKGDATWADSEEPYEIHTGDTIRIHGYLAAPRFGGPYPAIVIGHGHGGQGSKEVALALAALGYVALSIDGPGAGQSTGGPEDTPQAWISVEEELDVPSPTVSYLYHYAYAGMRALTMLDHLSRIPFNPFHIDRRRFGVIGASMGGQLVYYVNGVDPRVKGAVAIAVAGDWRNLLFYEGSWLYHAVYYYTRDGIEGGNDFLNTITNVCPGVNDTTAETFLTNFDPLAYAPTQHAPLLTIVGTHDPVFTIPAINTTYDRVGSAGTDPRFIKRIVLAPNGKHEVVDRDRLLGSVLPVLADVHAWLRYCFRNGATPPETPEVRMRFEGDRITFAVSAPRGDAPVHRVRLYWATQLDTVPPNPCDFGEVELRQREGDHRRGRRRGDHWSQWWSGSRGDEWEGSLPFGAKPACGPEATPENVLYYASVEDAAGYTVSSKLDYGFDPMTFESAAAGGFVPVLEHFPGDDFPVPRAPRCEPQ